MKYPLAVGRNVPRLMPAVVFLALSLLLPRLSSAEAFDRADLRRIESRVQAVAEQATPAIVALTHPAGMGTASGTGTVVSRDGIILTAAHVVANTEAVDVTFP